MANGTSRNRRSSGRVTLADVAKVVGVGQMTVSRALRTPEMVSEPLRKRIEEAIIELGYIPHFSARQLASAESHNLVIVTTSISSTENTLILSALRKSLADSALQMVILIADQESWFQELINHAPQAIVFLNLDCPPNAREWIKNSNIPTVEIGAIKKEPIHLSVGIDSHEAMEKMIHFLVKKGYREIGLLSAKQDLSIFKQYLESWHTTLFAHHIAPLKIHHVVEDISFSAGATLLTEALLNWEAIDALVFLSDELACGALYEALRRHMSIPKDLAIAGLGGLEVGSISYPKLTTIAIPYEQMGKIAGKQLLTLLSGKTLSAEEMIVKLPTKLVIRDSTA
ncbi:LacI family transcriptional regulator [Mannheimia haemolytica]|nr:LacI family transcriptional regulator [Mannheimia haemolytica]STY61936.1 Gluconate utilization system GNT-I transcriptional repressor [Mannheimia haemolytica]